MSNTVKIADELYIKPPRSAPEGAQFDHRSVELEATDLITTQLVALAVLPAGHKLVSLALESDALDSNVSKTITGSLGILNSDYGDALDDAPDLESGKNIFTESTVFQSGGRVYPALAFTDAIGVDNTKDRIIALKFTAAPATAAAGGVGVVLGTMPA